MTSDPLPVDLSACTKAEHLAFGGEPDGPGLLG